MTHVRCETADDDRVTVEWPFSRLVLDEPPVMMVPAAVRVKKPRKKAEKP